jgi:hypothetical protein
MLRHFVSHMFVSQAFFFVAAAAVHGVAFFRWRLRWSKEDKQSAWPLYGWFTGLSCVGSIAGASAYSCWMAYCYFLYRSRLLEAIQNPTRVELQLLSELRVDRYRFIAAFHVLFPLELAFVTVSKLFVLHRMQQFSFSGPRTGRWELAGRVFLAVVITCNVIGVVSNIAASIFFSRASGFDGEAAAAFAANDTVAGSGFERKSVEVVPIGLRTAAIQGILECLVLVMIITAFVVVGLKSLRVIGSALRTLFTAGQRLPDKASDQGRQLIAQATLQGKMLQRKVVGTIVFLFLTILVRSAFRVLFAFATFFQNSSDSCAVSECDACKNVYSHILYWLLYTPMLQQGVVLIASPIALLVAFWGMSGVRMLQQVSEHDLEVARKQAQRQRAAPSSAASQISSLKSRSTVLVVPSEL